MIIDDVIALIDWWCHYLSVCFISR